MAMFSKLDSEILGGSTPAPIVALRLETFSSQFALQFFKSLRAVRHEIDPADTPNTELVPRMELAAKYWVEDQANWYAAKFKQQRGILGRFDHVSRRSFLTCGCYRG